MASTVPYGGDEFLREFERAIKQDGLKGAWITSSLQGKYPDDDEAMPFFQLAQELDVPVVIHPPSVGFGEERMRDYRLASSIGRPMDGALAIARLIVRGVFEKFPKLKLVGTHLGGGICEMIGRMNYAYRLQDEAFFLGSYEPMLIKHEPLHYLKMMYLESTCYHPPGARCAIDTVGVDHFLFGTDSPPLFVLKQEGVDLINKLGLTPEEKNKVYYQNAKKLLKLELRSVTGRNVMGCRTSLAIAGIAAAFLHARRTPLRRPTTISRARTSRSTSARPPAVPTTPMRGCSRATRAATFPAIRTSSCRTCRAPAAAG